ncbi:deoxyribonuclease-1-like isoform X2 [Dysidea avara]|uniref:deoxyribonuclease-1-like isoform X2 n=1 Tax=Dysidea avara TaxID=196820 RepID=UPI003329F58D
MKVAKQLTVLGIFLSFAIQVSTTPLHIGAFNLHIFGQSKFSESEVVSIISKIVRRYDIILLQEIRDVSETIIHDLLTVVNNEEQFYTYNIVVGPRLGRSSSKEQYAYIYRNETVQILDNYTHPDNDDVFEREPFVVLVRDLTATPVADLVLIGIHVRPSDAEDEINGLVPVYEEAESRYNTSHIIIMGDMNADCSYLSNARYNDLSFTTDSRFLWLISKDDDTTTANSSCAYDRFVVTRLVNNSLIPGSVLIYLFDREFNLTWAEAIDVSDHYPIELQLEGSSTTGSGDDNNNNNVNMNNNINNNNNNNGNGGNGDRPTFTYDLLLLIMLLAFVVMLL